MKRRRLLLVVLVWGLADWLILRCSQRQYEQKPVQVAESAKAKVLRVAQRSGGHKHGKKS